MVGVLDRVMQVEEEKKNRIDFDSLEQSRQIGDDTPTQIICDRCKRPFMGKMWMMKSKQEILCQNCFNA